jgi:transposase, IS5 family
LLPEDVLRLPDELARVDGLLDDPAFFAPFARYFDALIGRRFYRPLRMMP